MAQALSIVGENGIHGMEYHGVVERWMNHTERRQSKRFRFSPVSAHVFKGDEFEEYMILAWRFGLIDRSGYGEYEQQAGLDKSSYQIENEIIRLRREGWEYIAENDQPLIHRWANNVASNIPTYAISVATALAIAWLSAKIGLAK